VLADVVEYLRCPHCGAELALRDGTLRCGARHSFDVARQGYVSLLSGAPRAASGDSAAMVAARELFLGAGHFEPLEAALAGVAGGASAAGCVADLGAGTGRQLARVLDALPPRPGLALDVSPYALRRAARAHPSIGAVGCDIWGTLPVRSEAVGLLLNVFAPRNGAEMARVMAPGARLVVVIPTPRHLEPLAGPLGLLSVDEHKPERLEAELAGRLEHVSSEELEWGLMLRSGDLEGLVMMGPSAFHTNLAELRGRIAALPERVEARAAVVLSVWRRSAQAA
jgi:23S rRNA (guanine745-N1)-methyltransferase